MPTLTPEQLRTRILAILEPIHSLDPVLDSMYDLVLRSGDLSGEFLQSMDGILTEMLSDTSKKMDIDKARAIAKVMADIRVLEAANREPVEDPKNAIF